MSGSTITIVGSGTSTITASRLNDDYNAASDVEQVLTVGKADQTITFTTLDNKTYDADFELTATASSGLTTYQQQHGRCHSVRKYDVIIVPSAWTCRDGAW